MMITRNFMLGALALGVAGCMNGSAIQGTSDSLANRLRVGMTETQVAEIIGADQARVTSQTDATMTCVSYLYDEMISPKFVHAIYDTGRLKSASDGHTRVCELP